jgi:hypothetical protein
MRLIGACAGAFASIAKVGCPTVLVASAAHHGAGLASAQTKKPAFAPALAWSRTLGVGAATPQVSREWNSASQRNGCNCSISPRVRRVAVLRDPTVPARSASYGAIRGAASSFGVELVPIDTRERSELEQTIAAFAQKPDGGLILAAPAFAQGQYADLTALAARHHLPAVWPSHRSVVAGD